MAEYNVSYTIDGIEADSPREAAEQVAAILCDDRGAWRGEYRVENYSIDPPVSTHVDLEERDEG